MTDCEALRLELGAYVLGGLTATERASVDAHLLDCPSCAAELSELEELPVLLQQVSAIEVAALDGDRVERAGDELSRRRRRRAGFSLVAAASVAAAGILGFVIASPHGSTPPSFASAAGPVRMAVTVADQPGGTALSVSVRGLPENEHCRLVALSRSGARESVGSWTASYEGAAKVAEASTFPASQLASLTLLGSDGQPLVSVPTTG